MLLPKDQLDDMNYLSQKLRLLKKKVKDWTCTKTLEMKKDSLAIDLEIRELLSSSVSGILSLEDQHWLSELRKKMKHLLDHELLSIQLKSRVTWVEMGDANTEVFHSVAYAHRKKNDILDLKVEKGT